MKKGEDNIEAKAGYKRLYKLEALRGLAALYVVLHHALPHEYSLMGFNVMNIFRFGQEGVILFFLLSGFVIHYSCCFSRSKSFKSYFKRRFLRIYVPYVLILLAAYMLTSIEAGQLVDPQWWNLLGNLFMLQDWGWARPGVLVEAYMGNLPLWSLSYEWWFYMLYWPLSRIFIGNSAQSVKVHVAVAVAATGAAIFYCFAPDFFSRLLIYFMIWWSGVVLAEAFINKQFDSIKVVSLTVVPLLLVTLILGVSVYHYASQGNSVLFGRYPLLEPRHTGFAAVAIISALLWYRKGFLGFNTLIGLGLLVAPISYSLYISHWVFLINASYLKFLNNPVAEYIGYVLIMILFCWVAERVVYPAVKKAFS